MATEGHLDRTIKNQQGRVLWAVSGANTEPDLFGPTPLTDLAEQLLRERRPIMPTELVVVIQESGFRPDATSRQHLGAKNSGSALSKRFPKDDDGRWSAA